MEKSKTPTKLIYFLPVLWAIVLRCAIGLFPYSGKNKPPMYGDFEAQRHWMEITVNLPIKDWYFNNTLNDLNYWGLDYPPLTSYHSYFNGLIAKSINSNWTDLYVSRGSESSDLVALMRVFVLISEIFIYLPAISYYYFVNCRKFSRITVDLELILCGLFFPGIVVIDYGHFQYNVISLGLFIIACLFFINDRDYLGSIMFCCSLCYKQMELYHSLPIFSLLLGKCVKSFNFSKLLKLSLLVVGTFSFIFSPFIVQSQNIETVLQIFRRLFPVARGIYEDKVSNFWCAISVFFKFKDFETSTVFNICGLLTLIGSLPACIFVFMNPRQKLKFLYSTLIVALSFFLFSYQVHEKSILIPSASALLIIPFEPFWANFFLYVASLSMWPLFLKDNIAFATIISCAIFLLFFAKRIISATKIEKTLFCLFNAAFFSILLLSSISDPPRKYPFLYSLMISQLCCGMFLIQFLYFYWKIYTFSKNV